MARNAPVFRIVLCAAAVVLVLVPAALADKGGNGGGKSDGGKSGGSAGSAQAKPAAPGGSGSSTCGTAPRAAVTNTWAWGSSGSWALPGQQVAYHVMVFNDDVACGSSTFAVTIAAPDGFAVSMPQSTITLASASMGYLWAYVTSPAGVADGTYSLDVVSTRAGATSSSPTSYKVYSSDSTPPQLYYENPSNGASITGRTTTVAVASSDDHAVKQIDIYVDGVFKKATSCDGIGWECQASYAWSIRRVRGTHTATFKSYDWLGNVGVLTTTFTVN